MARPATVAKWRSIIARHNQSGLTAKEFAEREDLNAGTLRFWRSHIRRVQAPHPEEVSFTEMTVEPAPSQEETVVVALDELEAHIVVDRHTDLRFLRDVLAALC